MCESPEITYAHKLTFDAEFPSLKDLTVLELRKRLLVLYLRKYDGSVIFRSHDPATSNSIEKKSD